MAEPSPGKRAATDALAPPRQQVAPSEDAGEELDEDVGFVEGNIARFEGNPELQQVQAGWKVLAVGDTGRTVYAVQQALFDLGYGVGIHGVYNADTETWVKKAQHDASPKLAETGKVDQKTIASIAKRLGTRAPYVFAAQHEAPGLHAEQDKPWDAANPPTSLTRNVHHVGAIEKAAAHDALAVAKDSAGTFTDPLPAGSYRDRLDKLLRKKVVEEWESMGKGKAERHKDSKNLFSMKEIEDVGMESKRVTDLVFGSWAQGSPLLAGKNIVDKFELESARIGGMDDKAKLATAKKRVEKIVVSDPDVAKLHREHHVDRTRTVEGNIVDGVENAIAKDFETKLLETAQGWPATADPDKHQVAIQRFKGKNKSANRVLMWRKFGTLIHEYVHTLANPAWITWRKAQKHADPDAEHVLHEGVPELLARTVIASLNLADDKLKRAVEGAYYDEDETIEAHQLRQNGYQAETDRAERLVGAIGIHNLYAAYFVGQTDLVGL